jgi:CheY-like chemotaxis protein
MPTFEARKPVRGKRERVLVVDDEESVRELTAEMLGRLNYEVSSVSSGREAIEYCRRSSRLDLVVLDMIMPDMDGRTTYQRILEVRPDLRFVLASGDLDNPQAGELASKGIEILQKPFSLVHLSTKVSSALSSGRGRGIEPTV